MPTGAARGLWLKLGILGAAASGCGLLGGAPRMLADGKLDGAVSGLVLCLLLCYSLYVYFRPLFSERGSGIVGALWVLLAIHAVKLLLLRVFPGYAIDVNTYQAWATRVATVGPAFSYTPGYFLEYPPGFLYPLWAAAVVARALSPAGLRIFVETPPLIADLVMSALVFAFVRKRASRRAAYAAMLLVALNPALLFDTVVWGQSDSMLTMLMLLSVVLAVEGEYELGWAVAAVATLVKPQALVFLPVLGLFTLLTWEPGKWWRAALGFAVFFLVTLAPFQINHSWNWIFSLYASMAGFYRETSLNAFNLMALVGGIRQPDTGMLFGLTFWRLGELMLLPLYAVVGYLLWRKPSAEALFFSLFLAVFGVFMLSARMHERYLYPALVFAAPFALGEPTMTFVFGLVSSTFLFNLAYVKYALDRNIFLAAHDGLAMAAAVINLFVLGLAVTYGLTRLRASGAGSVDFAVSAAPERTRRSLWAALTEVPAPPPWLQADTLLVAVLLAVAAGTRFWHLNHPPEIVFDEVHFVGQGRHYLRGEAFLDPHPPLGKLLIALGIWLFGDHPWAWRVGNACLGTLLVALTYMLGRRMFASRLAATLAAVFVLCDGLFLVDSRIAVIDIAYLTFAAWSYLLLFRFAETADWRSRRRTLVAMGLTLGLCLSAKLYVPAMAFVLVSAFVVCVLIRPAPPGREADPARARRVVGALAILGSLGAIVYLLSFAPKYYLGWWAGIEDLFHYYGQVMWYEQSVATATHPYSSPWWSWPLMLRPVAYWQNFPNVGKVSTIWGAGNPLSWWGALSAIVIMLVQAIERPTMTRVFLVVGYFAYLAIWVPIGRILFLYHYMPSVYLGYLALAGVLAQCWEGVADPWERLVLLLTMEPAFALSGGIVAGNVAFLCLAGAYLVVLSRPRWANRLIFGAFVAAVLALFIYFFPIWMGLPIERSGYYARMWLKGPGLRNWI